MCLELICKAVFYVLTSKNYMKSKGRQVILLPVGLSCCQSRECAYFLYHRKVIDFNALQ